MPALNRARGAAQKTKCLSNLRQICQVFFLYAHDFYGYMPSANHMNSGGHYQDLLAEMYHVPKERMYRDSPYRGPSIFTCPNTTEEELRPNAPADYALGTHATNYGENLYSIEGTVGTFDPSSWAYSPPHRVGSLRFPSRTCLLMETKNLSYWYAHSATTGSAAAFWRHANSVNIGFWDGHSENRLPKQVPCAYAYPGYSQAALGCNYFVHGEVKKGSEAHNIFPQL